MPESDAERRAREKRSERMRKGATADPRGTSTGGTWQRNGSHMQREAPMESSPPVVVPEGTTPRTSRRSFGPAYGDQ